MPQDAYLQKSTEPESVAVKVRMVGTGANPPTRELGQGITITRTGTGAITLTFSETPGEFESVVVGLQAATISALAGFSVIVGTWNATTRALPIALFNGSNAAADLAATQRIHMQINFKRTSVS
jgi:hypothetical protein